MKKWIPSYLLLLMLILGASNIIYAEDIAVNSGVNSSVDKKDSTGQVSSDTELVHYDIGPYIGARVGHSVFEDSCPSGSSQCSEAQSAWGGMFGYNFSSRWAVEIAFTEYGDYQWANSTAETSYSDELSNVSLQGLYNLPLDWPFDIYVKAGGAYGKNTAGGKDSSEAIKLHTQHGVNLLGGVGLEYSITDNVAIRGEYEHVFAAGGSTELGVSSHDVGLLSLGFIYKFGSKERTVVRETIKYIDKNSVVKEQRPQVFIIDESEEESLFKNGETRLQSTKGLAQIVEKIQSQSYVFIKVIGHTDNVGSADENQILSEQRAKSVANYLGSQGIDLERIVVVGKGEINPLASNALEEDRAKNRRVEIIVERMAVE